MFSRQFRLPSSKVSFEKVIRSPYFTMKVGSNALEYSRFGFIVSKRIDKLAVGRNRLRRRLQQNMQELQPLLLPGKDILIIASPALIPLSQQNTIDELTKACKNNALFL